MFPSSSTTSPESNERLPANISDLKYKEINSIKEMRNRRIRRLSFSLLLLALLPISTLGRQLVLVLSQDDLAEASADTTNLGDDTSDTGFDDFIDSEAKPDYVLDPGSWSPIFEPAIAPHDHLGDEASYYTTVSKIVKASSRGDERAMEEAASEIEAAASAGHPHAQSILGFLYGMGIGRERNKAKSFLYHHFAAEGGNMQSKMALAYTYSRQEMHDKAVKLYAELAEVAINSFLISKDSPVIEPVRIHSGAEENKEALRKSRGEEDEDFQILEYQAQKGNAGAMYKIGIFYYFGLRGVRRDHTKALSWFLKAVEKGEARSMELLGEIYARGAGIQRNFTKALEWLTLASKQQLFSAYNGLGYLYVKGYGVEKNNTKAKEYFEKAAENGEAGGFYNLGVMYLKGIGVKRDVKLASKYLSAAFDAGQPKAFYQLAKMFQTGVGYKKNVPLATALYKLVAERGPWSSLSRWALESYLRGDVGKAFLLYSRMAELGYEIAQSNAAWILDKYGERSMCLGESGVCSDEERHQRAHALWWQASEQGNEHAALLIGDAYYYGRGTERDYERAAEAYMHAKSQSNAQAMFNLGYMHEHGQGLPFDLHLAKRYYDPALEIDNAAKLPVTLALASLWIRKNHANSFLDDGILVIPTVTESPPKIGAKEIQSEDYQIRSCSFSSIASMSGGCQVCVPMGFHDKCPTSVSFVARQGGDRFLLDTIQSMYASLQEQAEVAMKSSTSGNAISKEASAEMAKEKGNQAYKDKQWQKAIGFYTEAIKLNGNNAAYFSNRAAAYLETGNLIQAEADSSKAIDLDKKNVKAYLRRGTAREMLGYYKEAIEDFRYALVLEPTNKRASQSADRLKKLFP